MRYDFECPTDGTFEVVRPMADSHRPIECPSCGTRQITRLYSPPVISVPETSATDILNRHASGLGDPTPGMTQAETKWYANEMARHAKTQQGGKDNILQPSRSYPGGGNPRKVID